MAPGDTLVPYDPDGVICWVLDVQPDGLVVLDWLDTVIAAPVEVVATTHRVQPLELA